MNESIFQNKKLKYVSKKINYREAYYTNILRSLIIGKVRYCVKLYSYFKLKKSLKTMSHMSQDELAQITSLCRPGKLSSLNNR